MCQEMMTMSAHGNALQYPGAWVQCYNINWQGEEKNKHDNKIDKSNYSHKCGYPVCVCVCMAIYNIICSWAPRVC